jgi:Cellulose biosynthesis protein BcsS
MLLFVRLLRRAAGTAATKSGLSPVVVCPLGFLCSGVALADDWYAGPGAVVPRNDWIVAIDASTTLTTNKSDFGYAAATLALGGTLHQSGFRFRAEGLGGTYGYEQAGVTATGKQFEGGALAGYQSVWNYGSIGYYLGVNVRENTVPSPDSLNSGTGTRVGFKTAIDAYLNPTSLTMMSAYASYSTAYDAYYARARAGYAIFRNGYLGPELTFLGDDFYGQTRFGAHYSGVQLGALQFGIAGGYVWDRNFKDGYYGTLEVRAGF